MSFDIAPGEVVGIIGRNGAGKSTLLKVLSRITEPTSGSVELFGRVGSLLEVGVGFHPELTGRENIYLNGAILGMKRQETVRRFEEIVAFAGIERLLDTPVKHYSSGMYVRLAFAVAAHLEPEILIVDEVLAVGDAAFQRKCLGKMSDISKGGRTVLFVSHNLQAVQSLCGRAFCMDGGRIAFEGDASSVVAQYLDSLGEMNSGASWAEGQAPGNEELRLLGIRVGAAGAGTHAVCSSNAPVEVELRFRAATDHAALCVGFDLVTAQGVTVLRSYQTDQSLTKWPRVQAGLNRWRCTIPAGLLNAGSYYLSPRIGMHNLYWIVHLDAVARFEVVLDHGVSPLWASLDSRTRPGVVAPILSWQACEPA